MEKLKKLYDKSIKVLIVLLIINLLVKLGATTESNAKAFNDNNVNKSILFYENETLRNNYFILLLKMKKIEDQLQQINEYDNQLYSQLFGYEYDSVSFNTTNIDVKNDKTDTIFKYVDDKMLALSKQSTEQLNKLVDMNENVKSIEKYPNISPIRTIDFITISSPFGWRLHPVYKKTLYHTGIDISANINTKVYSTMDGVVTQIVYSKYGYGNKIVIKNDLGYETLYAHLSPKIYVKTGQRVKKNQLIGRTGNTGTSTGPHLHYEIRKNGELNDPLGYFYTYLNDELIALN